MNAVDACVVVPYRADASGIRRRNLDCVLSPLVTAGIDVIVVEHAAQSSFDAATPSGARHLFLQSDGPFPKAVACNAGFLATAHSTVAFIDADVLVRTPALLACIDAVTTGHRSVQADVARPFGWLVDLSEAESAQVAASGIPPQVPKSQPSDSRGDEHIPLCGGAFVISRTAYERAGGMDETFVGWGGEDDAFSVAVTRLGLRRARIPRVPALHLWHESARPIEGDPTYAANVERLIRWHRADEADFAGLIGSARDSLGRRRLSS